MVRPQKLALQVALPHPFFILGNYQPKDSQSFCLISGQRLLAKTPKTTVQLPVLLQQENIISSFSANPRQAMYYFQHAKLFIKTLCEGMHPKYQICPATDRIVLSTHKRRSVQWFHGYTYVCELQHFFGLGGFLVGWRFFKNSLSMICPNIRLFHVEKNAKYLRKQYFFLFVLLAYSCSLKLNTAQ